MHLMEKVLVFKSFDAMKVELLRILTYPILQVVVYCCIVAGSVYFYGPLILMHAIGVPFFQWNALAGITGVILTLLGVLKRFEKLQLWGTILMTLGLIPYLQFSIHGVRQITLTHPVSIVLIPFFGILSLLVLFRFFVKGRV